MTYMGNNPGQYIDDTALLRVLNAQSPIGSHKTTPYNTVPSNWILFTGTIGSATSGATTRANNDVETLFKLLWDEPWSTIGGGKGASANADWAANKQLDISAFESRFSLIDNSTNTGIQGGANSHVLVDANIPDHWHYAFRAESVAVYNSLGANEVAATKMINGAYDEEYQISASTGSPANAGKTSTVGNVSPTAIPTIPAYAKMKLIVRYALETSI